MSECKTNIVHLDFNRAPSGSLGVILAQHRPTNLFLMTRRCRIQPIANTPSGHLVIVCARSVTSAVREIRQLNTRIKVKRKLRVYRRIIRFLTFWWDSRRLGRYPELSVPRLGAFSVQGVTPSTWSRKVLCAPEMCTDVVAQRCASSLFHPLHLLHITPCSSLSSSYPEWGHIPHSADTIPLRETGVGGCLICTKA